MHGEIWNQGTPFKTSQFLFSLQPIIQMAKWKVDQEHNQRRGMSTKVEYKKLHWSKGVKLKKLGEVNFIRFIQGSDWNTFRDYPHILQNENVTKWEWRVFLKNLEDLPLSNINWYLAQHALTMLALCYLPGCLAGYIQIYRGTKYSKFPKFLDRWLKMRKQLGLLMLLSASLHVISLF